VLDGPPAVGVAGVGEVRSEERLAEPLAGAIGEGAHRVAAHPEQRRDLGWLLVLDLEVPQDQLPAFREGGEGARRSTRLERRHDGVLERHPGVERSTYSRRTALSR
jgi:hypothetical protein